MIRLSIVALALVLGSCGSGKSDERDAAAGKILPGSASDAMLQTDRLQSEAPLAAPKLAEGDEAEDTRGSGAKAAADEPDDSDTPEAEAAAPVVMPAPVAAPANPPAL